MTSSPSTSSQPTDAKVSREPGKRDAQGRFTKGNPGGPGNPFARQTAKLRQAVVNAITEKDMQEFVDVLKKKAREGDLAAIKMLLSYGVGRPTPAENPDMLDQQELGILVGNHTNTAESMMNVIEKLPVDLVLSVLHLALPGLFNGKKAMAKHVFENPPAPTEYELDDEDEEDEDESDGANGAETEAVRASMPKPAEPEPTAPANPKIKEPSSKSKEDEEVLHKLRERFSPPSLNGTNGHGRQPALRREDARPNGQHPRPPMANGTNGRKR